MKKFHSTVTRRDFMKGLGLVGAGIGTAAATAPVFNDLDAVMSSPSALQPRPWYVSERELFDPTVEVDWSIMNRFDRHNEAHTTRCKTYYMSDEVRRANDDAGDEIEHQRMLSGEPGWDVKWQALDAGHIRARGPSWEFVGIEDEDEWSDTPEELGIPAFSGTPEDNSRLLMAAAKYYGASLVGFAELDSTWRNKLVVKNTTNGARNFVWSAENPDPPASDSEDFVYENVDQPYVEHHRGTTGRDAGKCVIPTKPLWLIQLDLAEAREMVKTEPSTCSKANNSAGWDRINDVVKARIFNFVRTLGGWRAFGYGGHQDGEVNYGASAVLTGIGESSRQNNYTLTPETGPIHNPCTILTDMPLAPTKPIDAGMWKFCKTCTKCADMCPSESISFEKEPSWDIPLKDGKTSIFHNPGVKHFWTDMVSCGFYHSGSGGCWRCYATCTFSEDKAAMIHAVVKGTIATTGLFNGFFANMSDFMGYGRTDPDEWWDMSLPAFGFDSNIGAGKGGYQ